MVTMNDLRPLLETVLMRRISLAVSTLPDGGRRATPYRADVIRVTVDGFVSDIHTIIAAEFEPFCSTPNSRTWQ
jgi:hypothetical protein